MAKSRPDLETVYININ